MREPTMMTRPFPLLLAALALVSACKEQKTSTGDPKSVIARVNKEKTAPRLPVLGERRLQGESQDLRASPDGELLTALQDAKKPTVQGVPPPMRLGTLWVIPTKGGTPKKLGAGVVNMPGGWLHTADSRWILFSTAWEPTTQLGQLFVQDAKRLDAEPKRIAGRVNYYVPSDDGSQVAFIADGVLMAGPLPEGPFRELAGEVSTAEFSTDGRYLYFKRKFSSAGGLYQIDLKQPKPEPRRLIDQVTEYTVLHSGKHVVVLSRATPGDRTFQLHVFDVDTLKSRKVADDAHRYRVSRDGRFLAWRDNVPGPDKGALSLMALPDGKPRELGKNVADFDFSPDGARFVYRDNYNELALGGREGNNEEKKLVERVGDLSLVEMPDGAPKLLAKQSPNFLFAPGGSALAFTARIERPEVTRRLFLYPVGASEPLVLKDWLYEYQFPASGDALYFRSDCLREGRACDVNAVSARATKDDKPRKIVDGTYGFRFSADGKRALLAFAHLTDQTFDIALKNLETGDQKMLDQYVEWPALLLPDGAVAYLVNEKQRPGVYVAKSP
jgi:hypothetical protein